MNTKDLLKLVLDLSNRLESVERKLGMERLGSRPTKAKKRDPRPVQDEVTPPKYEEEDVEEYDLDVNRVPLMSNTELVQVCRAMGAKDATRQLPREELLTAILEDKIPTILDPLQEEYNARVNTEPTLLPALPYLPSP